MSLPFRCRRPVDTTPRRDRLWRYALGTALAATAVITPFRFAFATGHFRSSLIGAALDSAGTHLPWYTHPAIDFLSSKVASDKRILEFGVGHSTIWWGERAHDVFSLEENIVWYDKIKTRVQNNVILRHVLKTSDAIPLISSRLFDIIIIDGYWRFRAAEIAINHLREDGALVIDDSECHWGPDGSYPIMDLLRDSGFSRVDFYGFAPGIAHRRCTSIAFRNTTFLLDGRETPKRID